MDKPKQEPLLPKQFAHLEDELRQSIDAIKKIDKQIDEKPRDKGLRPGFNPPGYHNPPFDRDGMINKLENEKSLIRGNFNQRIESEIKNADLKLAKNTRDAVEVHLGDNVYNEINKDKQDGSPTKIKKEGIDLSQDFMNRSLANYRATIDHKPEENKVQSMDSLDATETSASERFMNRLNYTKEVNKDDSKEVKIAEKYLENSRDMGLDER